MTHDRISAKRLRRQPGGRETENVARGPQVRPAIADVLTSARGEGMTRHKKILVVDDSVSVRQQVSLALIEAGF